MQSFLVLKFPIKNLLVYMTDLLKHYHDRRIPVLSGYPEEVQTGRMVAGIHLEKFHIAANVAFPNQLSQGIC